MNPLQITETPFTEEPLPPIEGMSLSDLGHWLRLLWPVLLVLGAGGLFFIDAIVATIVSTPHPALVYAILGVFVMAVAAAVAAVQRYLQEKKYAQRWAVMSPTMRQQALQTEAATSVFMPVYDLLTAQTSLPPASRQAAVANELTSGEIALEQGLELPGFLGGALVGMGLIGTFIGLLGTLEDLSKIFSSLINASSATMSPTQMFTDMVTKLQAPMQGMGTAFVASLYGLLGSLTVTFTMVNARKTAANSLHHIHAVVRQLSYGASAQAEEQGFNAAGQDNVETLRSLKALLTMVEDLSRTVASQQSEQALVARRSTQILQELLVAGQATSASQKRTEETLQVQLASLKTVLMLDSDNHLAAVQGTRADAHDLIRSMEQCRTAFEQTARSLRAALASKENTSKLD